MTQHNLPATGFLRLYQIIGAPKADPPVPAIIPVSKSSWYNGIKIGIYPRPVRLGANSRTSLWRVEDILALVGADDGIANNGRKEPVAISDSRFGIQTAPTLLLIQRGSKAYIPVTAGVASASEIESKLYRGIRLLRGEVTPENFNLYEFQKGGGFDVETRR